MENNITSPAPVASPHVGMIIGAVVLLVVGGIVGYVLGNGGAKPAVTATPTPSASSGNNVSVGEINLELFLPEDWNLISDTSEEIKIDTHQGDGTKITLTTESVAYSSGEPSDLFAKKLPSLNDTIPLIVGPNGNLVVKEIGWGGSQGVYGIFFSDEHIYIRFFLDSSRNPIPEDKDCDGAGCGIGNVDFNLLEQLLTNLRLVSL